MWWPSSSAPHASGSRRPTMRTCRSLRYDRRARRTQARQSGSISIRAGRSQLRLRRRRQCVRSAICNLERRARDHLWRHIWTWTWTRPCPSRTAPSWSQTCHSTLLYEFIERFLLQTVHRSSGASTYSPRGTVAWQVRWRCGGCSNTTSSSTVCPYVEQSRRTCTRKPVYGSDFDFGGTLFSSLSTGDYMSRGDRQSSASITALLVLCWR